MLVGLVCKGQHAEAHNLWNWNGCHVPTCDSCHLFSGTVEEKVAIISFFLLLRLPCLEFVGTKALYQQTNIANAAYFAYNRVRVFEATGFIGCGKQGLGTMEFTSVCFTSLCSQRAHLLLAASQESRAAVTRRV